MRRWVLGAATAAAAMAGLAVAQGNAEDPNLWLEEVEGVRALAQVKAWNDATAKILTSAPGFARYRDRALAILNDRRQLAYPDAIQRERVTNFWQDAEHVRGLWRIAPLASYLAGQPQWTDLIDMDALAKAEGRNWVWKGAVCVRPHYVRCMVGLSDGGTDALEWREYDMEQARFVPGGFYVPAAKSRLAWLDANRLLVRSDFGPGSLTPSGYGRQVKLWRRGTALRDAPVVFEGAADDVEVSPSVSFDSGRAWPVMVRSITSWDTQYVHMASDGRMVRAPLPPSAEIETVIDGQAVAMLHGDWTVGGTTYRAGSLVAYGIDGVLAGQAPQVEPVYVPAASEAVEEVEAAGPVLYVKLLDNVAGRLKALTRDEQGGWTARDVPLARNSVVHLLEAGGSRSIAFVGVEGLTSPETLYAVEPGEPVRRIAALPGFFDAATMEVSQRFASSADGTRIPYFVVRKKGTTGPVPTLMHAYGGFRLAQHPVNLSKHPSRLGPLAQFWVEDGGAFVLANIRGGGEFGPAWHESVLKANRQKAFDDFHAVAADLKAAGLASKLGISGRSNGGLLVGVAYTQRPDLYDAVLMGVPLSDMKRYSKLLAGASWMGEYGDPDKPEDWAYISKYSPYQNLKAGAKYPAVMIYTSTKDDRVHPGHARKMAARMASQGHPFYYYENMQGGHAGSADKTDDAYRATLMMTYLNRELKGVGK